MSTENGNTTKYRLEQVEKCCEKNKEIIEKLKFVLLKKDDIMELNLMRNDIQSINKKLDAKDERDKWFMRLLIGTLITGILTPIVVKYLGL
jgi:hypothetical protein